MKTCLPARRTRRGVRHELRSKARRKPGRATLKNTKLSRIYDVQELHENQVVYDLYDGVPSQAMVVTGESKLFLIWFQDWPVGWLDLMDTEITAIEVLPEFQRLGIATAAVRHICRRCHPRPVCHNMPTEDGEELFRLFPQIRQAEAVAPSPA